MPWRNEGRQPGVSWRTDVVNPAGTCHYLDRWRDKYALLMRRKAVSRLLPYLAGVQSVVDLGCGDGLWLAWLAQRLQLSGEEILGVDVARFRRHEWPFLRADMESLPIPDGWYDLAVTITSLCQVTDLDKALREAVRVSRRWLLVLDFMLEPVPEWAQQMPHRVALPRRMLDAKLYSLGYGVVADAGCGPVDGALFVRLPRWLWPVAALVTLIADWLLMECMPVTSSKYQAVLYRRSL